MADIKILIVEDEEDLARLLSYNLKKEGFVPVVANNGDAAVSTVVSERPALVLLDLMLPGMGGMEICRLLKADPRTSAIPVIMLTARSEEIDKVLGLELGADDYITKPFGINELMARVRAVLRRAGPAQSEDSIGFGDIRIIKDSCTVVKGDRALELSATEYRLLLYLAERQGKVFSRDKLLDALWGDLSYVEPRTVDVHISRLRSIIEDEPSAPRYIRTRRGIGYFIGEDI